MRHLIFIAVCVFALSALGVSANADWVTTATSILDMNIGANIASTPDGTLYASGITYRVGDYGHWILGESHDGGKTWTEADRYMPPGVLGETASLFVSAKGDIYEIGAGISGQVSHWITRKRDAHGVSTTVDDFYSGQAFLIGGVAAAQDSKGRIYVLGAGENKDHNAMSLIRISNPSGKNWTTLAEVPTIGDTVIGGTGCMPQALALDAKDEIYVGQSCFDNDHNPFTTFTQLYHSDDHGKTWDLLDTVYQSGKNGRVVSIGSIIFSKAGDLIYGVSTPDWTIRMHDHTWIPGWKTVDHLTTDGKYGDELSSLYADAKTGKIWAVGTADTQGGVWTTRVSSDNGFTWTDSDKFSSAGNKFSEANSIVRDGKGNLFVAGNVSRSTITIRKLEQ